MERKGLIKGGQARARVEDRGEREKRVRLFSQARHHRSLKVLAVHFREENH